MNKFKIFCDFDGTITENDVWIAVGEYFINKKDRWVEVIRQFENLEIGARECFLKECELIENFDKKIFDSIIDSQKIDVYFKDFKSYCDENKLPLVILSEGMDYYIERILSNNNIDLKYYSNGFRLTPDEKSFHLEYPYSDYECTKCGCCKRNLIINMCADDEIAVYIGDGYSDVCAVNYADIVFAKKSLASYCWKNNITYFDYKNFDDVIRKLEKLLTQKNIKHRQTARLKIKDVLLQG
jgi:2-hydroxy-3-keto-5-methylthiopentenyl-1-phosphate phosphatase